MWTCVLLLAWRSSLWTYGHCGDLLIVGEMTKLVPTTKNKACVRPMKGYSHNMWPCMVLGIDPELPTTITLVGILYIYT